MKHLFYASFLFVALFSCSLSAEQEQKLNSQMGKYMKAYNEGRTLELAAFTHVSAVKYYQELGDSSFLNHFYLNKVEIAEAEGIIGERNYYSDYTLKETKTSGKRIQCKFWVKVYVQYEELKDNYGIYAISDDDGKTWYFLNEDDYFNKEIKLKRLFTK